MKICPFCHSELEDNAIFCPECGKKQERDKIICPACGSLVPEESRFCQECGNPLKTENDFENYAYNQYTNYDQNAGMQDQRNGDDESYSGMAIAGFVLSFLIPILGIIFSAIGLSQCSNGRKGRGLAIAGLVISIMWMLFSLSMCA